MKRIFVLLLVLLTAACAQTFEPVAIEPAPPRPFILDADMAHEDMFAALFLMQHPNVDLRALTVSGTGEAHCGPGVANALDLAMLGGRPDLPVACGRETPLQGNHAFPAAWRVAVDDVYGVELPDNLASPSEMTAPELIAETIRESAEPVTLVAVGPLTNVADALRDNPDLIANIAAIYVMGGAIDVDGNVGQSGIGIDNQRAEWNIYVDPVAANQVLASGAPVVLVPLDTTADVPINSGFVKSLGSAGQTPAAEFVHDVLQTQSAFIDSGGFHFWDSFTAALALDGNLAELETMPIRVVEDEGPQSGWTVTVPDGTPVQVAVSGEARPFEALLLTVLNRVNP